MGPDFSNRISKAVKSIRYKTKFEPRLGIVVGTGLSGLLSEIDVEMRIPYSEISDFPDSTAPGHSGELVFGKIGNTKIVAQNGRFHLYEGWSTEDVVLPVYVLKALGISNYIITNAAGALNAQYDVADIMLITDHMNFQGAFPLTGPNDAKIGPRFPDLSNAYDRNLRQSATDIADQMSIILRQGIYVGVHGPEFETSAERRFYSMAGGDAVGMSTVAEVIAANHVGLNVLGFSAITNSATGGEDQQPDTLEEVLENSHIAAVDIRKIILAMITARNFDTP